VQGLAIAGRAWLFAVAGERGVRRVREALFRSLVSQEIAFFDGQRTGDLTSRLGSDTSSLQGLLSSQLSMALRNGVQVVGGLALLVVTSPRLTAVMLLVVPAVAAASTSVDRRTVVTSTPSRSRIRATARAPCGAADVGSRSPRVVAGVRSVPTSTARTTAPTTAPASTRRRPPRAVRSFVRRGASPAPGGADAAGSVTTVTARLLRCPRPTRPP